MEKNAPALNTQTTTDQQQPQHCQPTSGGGGCGGAASATAVAAEDTDNHKRMRLLACILKLLAENDRVKVSWRPFAAACEAVYPFLNPAVLARSVVGRAFRPDRLARGAAVDAREAWTRSNVLAEVAAVGAGAVRCARQLRATCRDCVLEAKLVRQLRHEAQKPSTMYTYGTLEDLFRRYDPLAAAPCTHGDCNVYCCFSGDSRAVSIVLRRCRVSDRSMLGALRASLHRKDGVFAACLGWAESGPDGKDAAERVAAGQMLNSILDNARDYCMSAASSGDSDAMRTIVESPTFRRCHRDPVRVVLLEFIVCNAGELEYANTDEKCDLLLRAVDAPSGVPPEILYRSVARCLDHGRYRIMLKLFHMLRSVGGVREFEEVDRLSVADTLIDACKRGDDLSACGYRDPWEFAADLVRQVKAEPLVDLELEVQERAAAKQRKRAIAGDAEPTPPDSKRQRKSD